MCYIKRSSIYGGLGIVLLCLLMACSDEKSHGSGPCLFGVDCFDVVSKNDMSSESRLNSSSSSVYHNCDVVVPELQNAPRCYPSNYGQVIYVQEDQLIYSCEDNEITSEGYWRSRYDYITCDEYVYSSSSCSFEESESSSSEENFSESEPESSSSLDVEYGTLRDNRDGELYQTIEIGSQVWMAENLRFQIDACYCDKIDHSYMDVCLEYISENGWLYTWADAIDSVKLATDENEPMYCGYTRYCGLSAEYGYIQGICPDEWHIPSEEDFRMLIDFFGSTENAGAALKEIGWFDNGELFLWSFSEKNENDAYYLEFNGNSVLVMDDEKPKNQGMNVRCVKD